MSEAVPGAGWGSAEISKAKTLLSHLVITGKVYATIASIHKLKTTLADLYPSDFTDTAPLHQMYYSGVRLIASPYMPENMLMDEHLCTASLDVLLDMERQAVADGHILL